MFWKQLGRYGRAVLFLSPGVVPIYPSRKSFHKGKEHKLDNFVLQTLRVSTLCHIPSTTLQSVLQSISLLCDAKGPHLDEKQHQRFARDVLALPVDALIRKCWSWYAPLMLHHQDSQWREIKDRRCIVAIDGNAKLHRRACGHHLQRRSSGLNFISILIRRACVLQLCAIYF